MKKGNHMGRMCRFITAALLAAATVGCGSTAEDRLVLRFITFDGSNIEQADSIRETSADVDVQQEICAVGPPLAFEPFTQTTANVVFRNEQKSDIRLERYTVDIGPTSGRAKLTREITATIAGGRCSNVSRQCAVDLDCLVGTNTGNCTHGETTVGAILLFDFDDKLHVIPGTYDVKVTFFGSDANQSFRTSASYQVRFDDFNNCEQTGTGAGS